MAEVSSLEAIISVDAKPAVNALDDIIQKLDSVIGRLSSLGQNKGFDNFSQNIKSASETINSISGKIKEATKAIEPQMRDTTKTIEQVTTQYASLRENFGFEGSTSANSISKLERNARSLTRQMLSAIGIIGGFGAAIKGIKDSIPNFTNYIESYNYFNVAFEKIASEWDRDFEKYGYDNAESYAESFTKRMNETLGKLSGVQVNLDTGLLEETGMKNLGLNIQQITQYASQLASVTNSIGQTGEVSLAAASSFTKLAGDISSLFNMDYGLVAQNLNSALIGQSRAVYRYGIDITNATLGTYAYNLGLEKSVSEMTQAEKMQLRMLAILDQSKVSWGDLANTIQSPSNMLRQFQNNLKEVSMVFGQLFIPVLQKVMPVINGITIAIKRLLVSFAQILGISIDFDSFGQGYADLGDGADGLSDALDGVAASAKKAKAGLRAFDELKVINMPDTSGIGAGAGVGGAIDLADEILAATAEYEKAWNEAFAKMENTAQEWADKIEKILEPVRKIFKDFAVGDFFQAGKDTAALVTSIIDFFADAIDRVDWYQIGKDIGDFLAGIDWFSMLKSVGNLIWQAIKAAFELYAGVFSAAPIETALISLAAMPKLLKTITASKFITGIVKLWKNFGIWGEKLRLVVGALTGNKAAASGLAMLYPKLGAKVDAVKNAFANFSTSVSQKGLWKTIDGGIANIRNNLGGLQKAAIVAVAGFAEFSVVSSSIEKLTLGTENWLAEIGKIAGVVAAAGAAMYVALGPAGLVAAAITGITAGILGIESAMQQINAETIGNTIRDALTTPGGVSMGEIAGAFNEKMSSIANSFDNISQHSQALEIAQANIKNTFGEISAIQSAMEQGAISVEDGVSRINTAFKSMSAEFNTAIEELEKGIIGALGEGSVLRQYLAAMGYDVEALNGIVVGDVSNIQKEFDKLTEEYESIKESTNPEDIVRKEEILKTMAEISGVFDDTAQSMTAFRTSIENMHLNMSSVIDTEGLNFKKEEFESSLQSMVDSYNAASTSIKEGNETFQNNLATLNNMLKAAGIEENTATYSEIMSKIPKITIESDNDLKEAFGGIINTIQEDALGAIPALIEQASAEWENLDFKTKSNLIYEGISNKDAYIASVIKSYEADVLSPMEEQINNALKQLNIDQDGIMVEKAKELYDSLFYYDYQYDLGGGERTFRMRENWESILADANLTGISEKYGKNTVESFNNGVKNAISSSNEAAKKWMSEVDTGIHDSKMNFGSPSKTAIQYGLDTVLGFNQGITENTQKTINAISVYMEKINEAFSPVFETFEKIGKMILQGLKSGMSQMEGSLYDKANSIADNIANTIKTALDIHSPSRVMFELGDYTMQGFQNGLENLYQPILSSVKTFGRDLQLAPAPNLADMYANYRYAAESYMPTHETSENMQGTSYSQSNAETNALLRQQNELLRAILAKPNIGKGELFDINREMYRMESTRRYGNPAAYDPIWGS